MQHRMPPSKTGWPSLNVVIFPPVMRLVLDDPQQWRPPEMLIKFTSWSWEDRRISAKSTAQQLCTSRERVGSIIHEDLHMRKLSAKWVPKCLNANQKRQWCQSSEQLLEFFGTIQMISCRDRWPRTKRGYITMTRKQSNESVEWRNNGLPRPKKFRVQKIRWKTRLDFLGWRRHPPHWLSSKGPTINAEYYSSLLVQLKDILKEKRRRKFTKGALFLHNAPAHRALAAQKKMVYLGFHCLDHPPYSPHLASSDYHLFPGLKKQLKGRHFSSKAEVVSAAETWLDGSFDFFFEWLAKVRERAEKCTELRGEYVE